MAPMKYRLRGIWRERDEQGMSRKELYELFDGRVTLELIVSGSCQMQADD
jgi:hypothetical protein